MINLLDYLFYKMYTAWSHILYGKRYPFDYQGPIIILLMLNYVSIDILAGYNTNNSSMFMLYGIFIILFVILYSLREKKFLSKFKNESKKSCTIGNIAVITYVIASIILFILSIKYY